MLRTRTLLLLITLFFVVVGIILFVANVNKGFDHDEHLYVAGGALVSKSFMPYRDFHYIHMPYLAFAYGMVFRFTDHLLLAARALSTIGGLLTLAILFTIAFNLKMLHHPDRLAVSVGSTLLVLTNPLFMYTTGKAWNHDLSVLFALAAFFTYYRSIMNGNGKSGPLLAGILLGLAIGTRLSFALVVPAFFLSALHPAVRPRRQVVEWLTIGLALSLAPLGLPLASYTQRFVFDSIGIQRVAAEWLRQGTDYSFTMTLLEKYRTFRDAVFSDPRNVVLGITYMICGALLSNRSLMQNLRADFGLSLSTLILLFVLVGAIMTVSGGCCYQYFYALVPFLTLGIMFGIAILANEGLASSGIRVLALSVLISTALALSEYRFAFGNSREEWTPSEMHSMSHEVRRYVANGSVLTLAPIVPLEAGLDIYTEFASGPFVWKSAHLVPKERRRILEIVAPVDLNDLLMRRPPQAILTGFEVALEEPLVAYARANQFRDIIISTKAQYRFQFPFQFPSTRSFAIPVKLWVSPEIRVNDPPTYSGP